MELGRDDLIMTYDDSGAMEDTIHGPNFTACGEVIFFVVLCFYLLMKLEKTGASTHYDLK